MPKPLPLALALLALAAPLAACAGEEVPTEAPVVEPEAEVVTEPTDDVVVDSTLLEPGPALEDGGALEEGEVGEGAEL